VNRVGALAEAENHHPGRRARMGPRRPPLAHALRRRDHRSRPRAGPTVRRLA
jgi:hypothetical protein